MADEVERSYYHRVPQDIPISLLALMRDWIEAIDLIHVFDDRLGLLIRDNWFVWPVTYVNGGDLGEEIDRWQDVKERESFRAVEVCVPGETPGELWQRFRSICPEIFADLIEASPYLLTRYNRYYSHEDGDFRLVYVLLDIPLEI
jgi:hypothetical protein